MANGRPRVAIVDDDLSVRRALARLLIASSFDARAFESGQAFLDSLPDGPPDFVVLDLHMPGMNGLDVLAAMADAGVAVPVIMISGHAPPEAQGRWLSAGAPVFPGKPLVPARF